MMRWYRVKEPTNPLCGCDVMLREQDSEQLLGSVIALRRVDVLLGDRPYQLFANGGQNLGIWIDPTHLIESPIQDDVVEIATDNPHGKFIEEDELVDAGCHLHLVLYERALQAAYRSDDGDFISNTFSGTEGELRQKRLELVGMLHSTDHDALWLELCGGAVD